MLLAGLAVTIAVIATPHAVMYLQSGNLRQKFLKDGTCGVTGRKGISQQLSLSQTLQGFRG
jgi:hypothetical protein